MHNAQRPLDETSSTRTWQGRGCARWRRRYLNARAIAVLVVLLGLLAAEVAAILNPAV